MEKYFKKVGKRYQEIEYPRFGDIDFIEFCFLVEACFGRRPIARSMFFSRVIDEYYHVLTQNERDRLFEWLNKNHSFNYELLDDEESCLLFNARFDKNNQYLITTKYNEEEMAHETFKFKGGYCTAKNHFVNDAYIIKTEKIFNDEGN
jgi:hypothetical protein